MSAGSDERSMKRSSRGRKPQYTWLVVFCLGELYVDELRSLKGKRPIMGFTQTDIHDCVKQYIDVKNSTIIKNAIYDAESHGWVARRKVRERGRDLFVPTKSGLIMYMILSDLLFDINLLLPYLENPGKAREEIKRMLTTLELILNNIISQLSLYKMIAGTNIASSTYQKISKGLYLLEEIKNAMRGYDKGIPEVTEAIRLYNTIKYLLKTLKNMDVVGTMALCDTANRIIDSADPLTWDENLLG